MYRASQILIHLYMKVDDMASIKTSKGLCNYNLYLLYFTYNNVDGNNLEI